MALARTVRFPRVILERANEIHRELTSGERPSQAAVSIKTRFKNESIMTHYKICYLLQHLKSRKPKLSNVGKELLRNMPDSRLRFEKPETVVSEAIENSERPNKRRHRMPRMGSFGTGSVGNTTQSTDEDQHLALDRILYNAYGDVASIVRKVQVEHEMNGGRIGDKESDAILRNAQNAAIKQFLFNFLGQQPDALLEALSMLKLSPETDNQSNPVESNNGLSAQSRNASTISRVSETQHEMSSNISIQNRQIVDRYISQPASPTIMANNMAERGYSMPDTVVQTPIRQPNSDSIQEAAKSNTNYDDWADDDFEDSLAFIPDVSPKNHSREVQRNERASGSHPSAGLSFNGSRSNESIANDFEDAFNLNATKRTDMSAQSQANSNFTQQNDRWSGTPEQFSPFIFTQSERSTNDAYEASPISTFDLGEFESFASYERDFGERFDGKELYWK